MRRRRALAGCGALVLVVAVGGLVAGQLRGNPNGSVRPGFATPAPTKHGWFGYTPLPVPDAHATPAVSFPARSTDPATWRLAYLTHQSAADVIEVRSGTGALVHRFAGDDLSPYFTLSPDGSLLVYEQVSGGAPVLHAVRSDGRADATIDRAPIGQPFCACNNNDDLEFAVSSDDRHVVVADADSVSIVTIGSVVPQRFLTRSGGSAAGSVGPSELQLSWSPDGQHIVFDSGSLPLRLSAGSRAALVADSLYEWTPATSMLTLLDQSTNPLAIAWSVEGQLAWLRADGELTMPTGSPVALTDGSSVSLTQVVGRVGSSTNASLSWSPDNLRLAIATDQLRLMDISNGRTIVVPQTGPDVRAAWLPDGTLLVTGENGEHAQGNDAYVGAKVFDTSGRLQRQFPYGDTLPDPYFVLGTPEG